MAIECEHAFVICLGQPTAFVHRVLLGPKFAFARRPARCPCQGSTVLRTVMNGSGRIIHAQTLFCTQKPRAARGMAS